MMHGGWPGRNGCSSCRQRRGCALFVQSSSTFCHSCPPQSSPPVRPSTLREPPLQFLLRGLMTKGYSLLFCHWVKTPLRFIDFRLLQLPVDSGPGPRSNYDSFYSHHFMFLRH
ncbi:hypothetical protein J6590_059070 [Homalodisca vitripennis]|nr:hypothetical protein J6590_059070 [Homalodisca vitripennis]